MTLRPPLRSVSWRLLSKLTACQQGRSAWLPSRLALVPRLARPRKCLHRVAAILTASSGKGPLASNDLPPVPAGESPPERVLPYLWRADSFPVSSPDALRAAGCVGALPALRHRERQNHAVLPDLRVRPDRARGGAAFRRCAACRPCTWPRRGRPIHVAAPSGHSRARRNACELSALRRCERCRIPLL